MPFQLVVFVACGLVFVSAQGARPQSPPPPPPPPPVVPDPMRGTSSIAVQVVADATGRPVKGAQVTAIVFAEATFVKQTVTDRNGRALLLGLTKGRVRISVGHQGFLSATYGQDRPAGDGTYLTLAENQQAGQITIRLKRGGAIGGVITNELDEPLVGVPVRALRRSFSNGRQVFADGPSDETDDRGIYRIAGLAPGEYLIGVIPRYREQTLPAAVVNAGVGEGVMGIPDSAAPPNDAAVLDLGDGRFVWVDLSLPVPSALSGDRVNGYVPTFYPGTPESTATIVTVGPAEQRVGVDFRLEATPLVRVSGRLIGIDEGDLVRATAVLVTAAESDRIFLSQRHSSATDASGGFGFSLVPRGQYTLEVRANADVPNRNQTWASVPVSVGEEPVSGLAVRLNRGMTLTGQLRFATAHVESVVRGMKGVQVSVNSGALTSALITVRNVDVQPDGRFVLQDLPPGDYSLRVNGLPYGWLAASAIIDGRDAFDFGLRMPPGRDVEGLVVTVTDQMAELSGALRNSAGQPLTTGSVIMFPSDRGFWTGRSRRVQGVRPGTDGRFVIGQLPPGEYLLAAADASPGQWQDPSFLAALEARATRIAVKEGEKMTRDLRR